MAYGSTGRLGFELGSKLGHTVIVNDKLVNQLKDSLDLASSSPAHEARLTKLKVDLAPSHTVTPDHIWASDGSFVILRDDQRHTTQAYVKAALIHLQMSNLALLNKEFPNPLAMRDIMQENATYHATLIPLRNLCCKGMSFLESIRHILFESFSDERLGAAALKTLNWLMYQRWDPSAERDIPEFQCPHCQRNTQIRRVGGDFPNTANCQVCTKPVTLVDSLGFHQEMNSEDAMASQNVATSYMAVYETLFLFAAIREIWECGPKRKALLKSQIFIKDGPLSVRAQYSKLVQPIRSFLAFAQQQGTPVILMGQEKSGAFAEYLDHVVSQLKPGEALLPDNHFINTYIRQNPDQASPYGKDTNYGAKVLWRVNERCHMVLNIPTGHYCLDPKPTDLLGLHQIQAFLPTLLSGRHENALVPIELVNGVASLSTYPSGKILELFSRGKET